MVKKNVKPVYQYTWFLSTILSYKNFILYDKLLTSFSIKNFSYIDIFEILKVAKLVTYSKNLDIFINFQVLFLKNNFCFIWDMLKNLVLKFCYRTN
ncbi:hypothetical protein CPARA_3gp382 (nucleomorph) [Cryptomonas paramecium]|uniref:Uncharacterized protein n=1 Tax=Cryptomonas paramaecium TaxID=2898 RepID=F2HIB6_9CRYP|nr:hypothetical protein CPARA_3gp382 [Cryptomonas paramecium]AEA39040.1 hypothetical protein CPARA_3gp382 [Cryptomonas paramecium]